MDKERREKPKKKKMKKPTDEIEFDIMESKEKVSENASTNVDESQEMCISKGKVSREIHEELGERGRSTPEDFCISHLRPIRKTAHFKDFHSRKLSELLEAFHIFDFDRDGLINRDDLRKTFASLSIDVENEEIDQMLSEGLNPLNFDAFVILLGCKTSEFDSEEVLLGALSNWDDHQEGLLSYERLMQHIMVWGDKFTKEEAVAAFADAPIVINKTKEKMIDYIQFSEDICGLRKMMQKKTDGGRNLLT